MSVSLSAMRIGVRLPQYGGTWTDIRAAAERAERLGFDGVWVNDHLQAPGRIKTDPTFEAMTTLAAVAPLTERVRLGVMVLSSSYRHAPLAVKTACAVDAIAGGGRMVVGLGTGSDVAEHRAYGFPFPPPRERTARLRETIEVFRAMIDAPDGATVPDVTDGAPNRPAATPPIWVAAHRPRLLRLAGRVADGVVGAFLEPDELAARVAIAAETRPAGARPLDVCLYTFALPLVPETEDWLRPESEVLGTTPRRLLRWLTTTGIVAAPDEFAERVRVFGAAGATDAVFALPSRTPPEAMDAIADALDGRSD